VGKKEEKPGGQDMALQGIIVTDVYMSADSKVVSTMPM
jgi:hypothetical protein